MTQRSWPASTGFAPQDLPNVVRQMLSTREEDISDYFNLPNQFVTGRKVAKVPASSADYDPTTDHVGDLNYDTSYLYLLVQSGSTAVWRRIALSSW